MPSRSLIANLSGLIKAKRREKRVGLRTAAKESNVSASTLSRLERGVSTSMPDTETLKNLSEWLGVSLSDLVNEKKQKSQAKAPELKTTEQVEVYLRADKNLAPETADALASAFKALYRQFTKTPVTEKKHTKG